MENEGNIQVLERQNMLLTEQNLLQQVVINKQSLRIEELEKRITHLENIQSKNSSNSSKPPSSDGFKRTTSMRKPSGKKPGGQKGHPGRNLPMVAVATKHQIHFVTQCSCCGHDISESAVVSYQRRQVTDVPPITIEVTEHMAEQKECPHCKTVSTAVFPARVSQPMQYGDNIRQWIVYMLNFLMVPVGRTAKFLQDFLGIHMSEGTVINIQKECAGNLAEFEQKIKAALCKEPVVHFDETGYYIDKLRQWLHVASTKELTLYMPHPKRGKEAMDAMGILPGFEGVAVHDFWGSYMDYPCGHELCNVHHLRDLTFCAEQEKNIWAEHMSELLLKVKSQVEAAKAQKLQSLESAQVTEFEQQYDALVETGKKEHPLPERQKGKRGKVKKSKTRNMIERFDQHRKSILGFMNDFQIPFDNNLAEQDIRMTKTKLKVSGCFRSMEGAENFALIRSYISTMRKQGINLFDALLSAITGEPVIPQSLNYAFVLSG
jgi:hypothetical protein